MISLKSSQGRTKLVVLIISALLLGVVGVISISNQCPCSLNQPSQNNTIKNEPAGLPAGEAGNPLAKALKSGLPVVADFGRGKCIPCKAMKSILEELMQTYKGRAEIFIFDIDEYKDLTEQYGINLIPTQIFFDKSGKEAWRHEGFLEKEKITGKLAELGVK